MLKKLLAITTLAALTLLTVPAAASAVTYVPDEKSSLAVTGAAVPPDEKYVGYIGLASTGYDTPMLLLAGGGAALLLGLALVTTSRRQRATA
ncbi:MULTISPECIES: LPXTG cell wall anchor domain-containing protein [unclassified Cryobacterium]|uniref:LPXTG cell wall anchor domain-containing protein n=1 Tax=unclassified Cryobacterium TaxID=2649013 RepID=UPI000CE4445F|nr:MULTISPECIES: LPXTG cell wall anchor domain-containing protein [unclassified Cryobacterium]